MTLINYHLTANINIMSELYNSYIDKVAFEDKLSKDLPFKLWTPVTEVIYFQLSTRINNLP